MERRGFASMELELERREQREGGLSTTSKLIGNEQQRIGNTTPRLRETHLPSSSRKKQSPE